MTTSVTLRVAAVAGLLGVAGCANAIQAGDTDVTHMLSPQFLAAATAHGELQTVVYGQPFGPGMIDGESIARQMVSPGEVPPFRFTTHPDARANTLYRVVLAFNPPRNTYGSGNAACADDARDMFENRQQLAEGGRTAVVATFCAGSRYVSQVTVYSPPARGADDPMFQALIRQTVTYLFPFTQDPRLNTLQGASIS